MLEIKTINANDTNLLHYNVTVDGAYIGYFLPNRSIAAKKDENWNFVSDVEHIEHFSSRTKNELVDTLLEISNNK